MALDGPHARMEYEQILRHVASLMFGEDPGRGALEGYADADWWDRFEHNQGDNVFEISGMVIKGILKGLDTIREKIEDLDMRIKVLESR